METSIVDRIADAVLYEGYLLYPYRPSVKNQHRWTFGGLYPQAYCQDAEGADRWHCQTECLVNGGPDAVIEVNIRFLHVTDRHVGELAAPMAEWPHEPEPPFRYVDTLVVDSCVFQSWQEAEESTITLLPLRVKEIHARPHRVPFTFPGRRWLEPIRSQAGQIVGVLIREQQTLRGALELSAVPLAEGLHRLTLQMCNRTVLEAGQDSREAAMLRTLASTHAILRVRDGEFISLLDPPEAWRELAASCRNLGTWPVLVGEVGQKDAMLAAPIILYDYPQVALESPGDLYDSTEIDEILTLRILTMTDEEQRQMAGVDERARALLQRTQSLGEAQLCALHGTIRPSPQTENQHEQLGPGI